MPFIKLKRPLTGWKIAKSVKDYKVVLVKLTIPAGATVRTNSSKTLAGKLRASRAYVEWISHDKESCESFACARGRLLEYRKNEKVKPHAFSRVDIQCHCGIHFFMSPYNALRLASVFVILEVDKNLHETADNNKRTAREMLIKNYA